MNGLSRAASTMLGAGIAGLLLWVAAQIGRNSTGGYWAAYGVVAGAGLVLAASQLRGRGGNPPAMLGLAFLPVLVAAGWVLLGLQPHANWFRDHVLAWSGDIGIVNVVTDVGTWIGCWRSGSATRSGRRSSRSAGSTSHRLRLRRLSRPTTRPLPTRRRRRSAQKSTTSTRRLAGGRVERCCIGNGHAACEALAHVNRGASLDEEAPRE